MKLVALVLDTFREIYAKKVILAIMVIEVVTLGITALFLFSSGMQSAYDQSRTAAVRSDTTVGAAPDSLLSQPEYARKDDSLLAELGEGDTTVAGDTLALRERNGRSGALGPPSRDSTTTAQEGNSATGAVILREVVKSELGFYAGTIAIAVLFLGIFSTAGIVPSMMEKGTIDLLVSKPIRRTVLLFGRALGGLVAIAINLVVFNLGVWALYGLASGVWYFPFVIWTTLVPLFAFATLYSAIILLNVLTDGWVLPMSLAYIHVVVLSTFLTNREQTLYHFITAGWARGIIDGLYWVLPQINDLLQSLSQRIFAGIGLPWASIAQCAVFAAVMLALAAWRFERRDF